MRPARTPAPPRQRATLVNARSRETRQALIRAALELWTDDDAYETNSAADIARAAGVSKGTFYFHFAGKEDILLEMSSVTARTMLDEIQAGIDADLALHPLTEQVMAAMARRVARAPRAVALQAGTLGFKSRAGAVTLTGPRLGAAFEALVRYGKQRGELAADVDEDEAAAMLAALTGDAVIRWGAGNRSTAWLRQTLRARAHIVLNGMARG